MHSSPVMRWSLAIPFLCLIFSATTVYAVDSCQAIFSEEAVFEGSVQTLVAKQTAKVVVQRIKNDTWDQSVVDAFRLMSSKRIDTSQLVTKTFGQTIDRDVSELIFYLRPAELRQIAISQAYRESLVSALRTLPVDSISVKSEDLKYAADIVNIGLLLNSRRESYFSIPEFAEIVKFEKLQVQKFPTLFRFDSRSPSEIKVAGGFFPKEKLPSLISEHTSMYSQGSGFVSTSIKEGNHFNLLIGPILQNSRKIMPSQQEAECLESNLTDRTFKWRREVREIYEYRIGNAIGTKADSQKSIEGEAEVVIPFVHANQVTHVRRVIYLIDIEITGNRVTGIELKSSVWSEWAPLSPES